jgi:DDE_Tnp_1-associated
VESPLLGSLAEALRSVPDTRKARGQRHPFAGLLTLSFLGCLCRRTELAVLQRWAEDNWEVLREPLGFTRDKPPHATTLSRTLAPVDREAVQTAFVAWLGDALLALPLETAAVDGKTSKQGHDKDGDPIHTLNVFVHDLKVTLAQWPVTDEKATEPEVLKAHLDDLLARYPGLSLFTADAIFCQRPLAALIIEAARHYLFAVKDNQPDMMEAMHTTFDSAEPSTADAQTREKRGPWSKPVGCGSSSTWASTCAPI